MNERGLGLFTLSSEGEPAKILSSTDQKPLRAAHRKPGQGPPPLRRLFQSERYPAGGQCANRPDFVGADVRVEGLGSIGFRILSGPMNSLYKFDSRRFHKADRLKSVLPRAHVFPCPIRIAQRHGGDRRSLRMAVL